MVDYDNDPDFAHIGPGLRASMEKLEATLRRVGFAPEPMYRCSVCQDSGVEEVESTRSAEGNAPRPKDAHYYRYGRPCKGPRGQGCPWVAWKNQQTAKSNPAAGSGRRELAP